MNGSLSFNINQRFKHLYILNLCTLYTLFKKILLQLIRFSGASNNKRVLSFSTEPLLYDLEWMIARPTLLYSVKLYNQLGGGVRTNTPEIVLNQVEICHQWEMVWWKLKWRESVCPNLLLWRHLQDWDRGEELRVEDVIQNVLLFTGFPDFPSCVFINSRIVWFVRGAKVEGSMMYNRLINRFRRISIEISGEKEGLSSSTFSQPIKHIFPLFIPHSGEKRTLPGLQMGGGNK